MTSLCRCRAPASFPCLHYVTFGELHVRGSEGFMPWFFHWFRCLFRCSIHYFVSFYPCVTWDPGDCDFVFWSFHFHEVVDVVEYFADDGLPRLAPWLCGSSYRRLAVGVYCTFGVLIRCCKGYIYCKIDCIKLAGINGEVVFRPHILLERYLRGHAVGC